jgi:hypothetical protein
VGVAAPGDTVAEALGDAVVALGDRRDPLVGLDLLGLVLRRAGQLGELGGALLGLLLGSVLELLGGRGLERVALGVTREPDSALAGAAKRTGDAAAAVWSAAALTAPVAERESAAMPSMTGADGRPLTSGPRGAACFTALRLPAVLLAAPGTPRLASRAPRDARWSLMQ